MTSLTTVIMLIVVFSLPNKPDMTQKQVVPSIDQCFAIAREFAAQAENLQLRLGGRVTASCEITVQPTREH